MTKNAIQCPGCKRQMPPTASICTRCRHTLEVAIVNVSAYYADLATLRTRQVRYGGTPAYRPASGEQPLAIDARFSRGGAATEVEYEARNTVVTWVRYIAEHLPPALGPTCARCRHSSCSAVRQTTPSRDTIPSCCAYLLRFADWLRISPVGAEVLADFTAVERKLRRLVDRPAEKWYAGPCTASLGKHDGTTCACACHDGGLDAACDVPGGCGLDRANEECGAQLYAVKAEGDIKCPACGMVYDIKSRRDWLLAYAEDVLATASEAARAITVLSDYDRGEQRLAARIRKWAQRGRIEVRGHLDEYGQALPTYRVGDILDLLAEDTRKDTERLAKGA